MELALEQQARNLQMEAAGKLATAIAAHTAEMQHLHEQYESKAHQMTRQHEAALNILEQVHQQRLQQQQNQHEVQMAEAIQAHQKEVQLMQVESLNAQDASARNSRQVCQTKQVCQVQAEAGPSWFNALVKAILHCLRFAALQKH